MRHIKGQNSRMNIDNKLLYYFIQLLYKKINNNNKETKDRQTEHKNSGQMDRTQIQNIRNKVEELNTDITIIMM